MDFCDSIYKQIMSIQLRTAYKHLPFSDFVEPECVVTYADVAFIFDGSGSVTQADWQKVSFSKCLLVIIPIYGT